MTPAAYYNEIDPFAAQWLRNLIAGGHIAPGEVDERSIEDVTPDDLRGFTQCHFFAGIGGWSHALRLARWPDNRPVWTGSCPCQPFSQAGKGAGFDDERHLWPAFQWLISECRPQHVFGEQVAAGNANAWFDTVQSDLEGMDYAFGLVPFTSASIGAPHIRERAYWVAESAGEQCQKLLPGLAQGAGSEGGRTTAKPTGFCGAGCMADASSGRYDGWTETCRQKARSSSGIAISDCADGLANAASELHNQCNNCADELGRQTNSEQNWLGCQPVRPLEVNGFWRDADWLFCRDGKWRPVEPGTFPLVARFAKSLGHGKSSLRALAGRNRTGRLKGYGNAINVHAAAHFINAYTETQGIQL